MTDPEGFCLGLAASGRPYGVGARRRALGERSVSAPTVWVRSGAQRAPCRPRKEQLRIEK